MSFDWPIRLKSTSPAPDKTTPQAPAPPMSMTRRAFLGAAGATGLVVAADAATHGRHQLEITHKSLPIIDLPDSFVGFRIVQISDIHFDEYTEPWYLERVVDQVNRLAPDLVLITGDFVSHGPLPISFAWRKIGPCAEILSRIKAETYGILGNHDAVVGASHIVPALKDAGIPMLIDSYRAIERNGDRLWICGADDAAHDHPDLNLTIPPFTDEDPVILLCHEPDYVDVVRKHPRFPYIDVMLSGHSHGGQVRLPLIGPLILPPLGQKYVEGLFHFDHLQLYVNRGIGAVGVPFRLNCPSEITEITLRSA